MSSDKKPIGQAHSNHAITIAKLSKYDTPENEQYPVERNEP